MTYAFVCYVKERRGSANRLGIVTGKKVGNAVKRNRARRVIREAFRLFEPLLKEKTQKRYSLNYTYLLVGNGYADGANCPNCGAAASVTGSQVCEYCGSRVAEVLKNTWKFTDIVEK